MLLSEVEIGEGEVEGNVTFFVLQSGGADFLGISHEVLEHTAAVPGAERSTVYDVEWREPQQQSTEIVESYQLAVIHERARYIPHGIRPVGVQIW